MLNNSHIINRRLDSCFGSPTVGKMSVSSKPLISNIYVISLHHKNSRRKKGGNDRTKSNDYRICFCYETKKKQDCVLQNRMTWCFSYRSLDAFFFWINHPHLLNPFPHLTTQGFHPKLRKESELLLSLRVSVNRKELRTSSQHCGSTICPE